VEMTAESQVDDPQAHALYDRMVQALREAETLYFESEYRYGFEDAPWEPVTYRAWLKKPNCARLEAWVNGTLEGVLVGDGEHFTTYWPGGRPRKWRQTDEEYERTCREVYLQKPSPPGRHSLAHETMWLAGPMMMTIIDLSTFHGYTDSLQPTMDGVTSLGAQLLDGREHDGIRVGFMGGQRTWDLWLSPDDHLPRRLRQTVHAYRDITTDEIWSEVKTNEDMCVGELFSWTPPEGWREWQSPATDLLPLGTEAPDLELPDMDGRLGRISDYYGRVVWLVFWRIGCPACQDEIPQLQRIHEEFADQGLTVLGINKADDETRLAQFLEQHNVTFRNLRVTLDSWEHVFNAWPKCGVPTTYIIDRDGKIAAAWEGSGADDARGRKALAELGIG